MELLENFDHSRNIVEHIYIKKNNVLEKVLISDIQYISVEGNYCDIHLQQKTFTIKLSLKKILLQLPQNLFIQVNKKIIIRTDLIEKINLSENKLIAMDREFIFGKNYKSDFLKRIKILS